jgi:hypothetical protein
MAMQLRTIHCPNHQAGRLSPRQAPRQGRHQLDRSADGPGEPRSGAEAEPRPYLPPSPSPGFWGRTQKFTWRALRIWNSGKLPRPVRRGQRFVRPRVAPSLSSYSQENLSCVHHR